MKISLDEFKSQFFNPERFAKVNEDREAVLDSYIKTPVQEQWTTYFMLLGALSAGGRIEGEEFRAMSSRYSPKTPPDPETLWVLTALLRLVK